MRITLAERVADLDCLADHGTGKVLCSVVLDADTSDRLKVFAACANQSIERTVREMIQRGLGDALSEMEGRE